MLLFLHGKGRGDKGQEQDRTTHQEVTGVVPLTHSVETIGWMQHDSMDSSSNETTLRHKQYIPLKDWMRLPTVPVSHCPKCLVRIPIVALTRK